MPCTPESGLSNQVAKKPIIAFLNDVIANGMCNAATCKKWRENFGSESLFHVLFSLSDA